MSLPAAFKDSIRQVCGPPPDEDALYEPNPVMDALKRRMNVGRARITRGSKREQGGSRAVSQAPVACRDGECRLDIQPFRSKDSSSRSRKDKPLKSALKQPRDCVPKPPIPPRRSQTQGDRNPKAHSSKVQPEPRWARTPTSSFGSFKEAFGSSLSSSGGSLEKPKEPQLLDPIEEDRPYYDDYPEPKHEDDYPEPKHDDGYPEPKHDDGYPEPKHDDGYPEEKDKPWSSYDPYAGPPPSFEDYYKDEEDIKGIDLSEGTANHSFTLLNSEVDGTKEELPISGWSAIHEFLTDTMDDPQTALTIMYNTERRPFGEGVLDAVYLIDRGSVWETVSRGFTEVNLYKETSNEGMNGYGFELVMRVAKEEGKKCPEWVMDVMAALLKTHANGEMKISLGDVFDIGQDLIPSIPQAVSLAITRDPKWREKLKTSFGTMCFYQVVPLSDKEGSLALELGTNSFLKALYFGQVPVIDTLKKDLSSHVLWSRFKDEVELGETEVEGLTVQLAGPQVTVVIPSDPLLVFRLLLALVHDLPTTWINSRTDLKCVWLRHNLRESTNPDLHKSHLHHVLYVSSEGLQALFSLFDSKTTEWAEAIRDSPPWPLTIEPQPRLALTIRQ